MTELLLIGDLHGKWQEYSKILEIHSPDRSIQIGDFGWGFVDHQTRLYNPDDPRTANEYFVETAMEDLHGDHKYFRGNHDNPGLCAEHRFCLPDVHYEEDTGIMIIAGADSIDKSMRTEGYNWWADEELSWDAFYKAMDLYEEKKPRIVLTHDGPESIIPYMFEWYRQEFPSRTRQALDSMFALHQPELWVFGHWHTSTTYHKNGTKFVCLAELEAMKLEV